MSRKKPCKVCDKVGIGDEFRYNPRVFVGAARFRTSGNTYKLASSSREDARVNCPMQAQGPIIGFLSVPTGKRLWQRLHAS